MIVNAMDLYEDVLAEFRKPAWQVVAEEVQRLHDLGRDTDEIKWRAEEMALQMRVPAIESHTWINDHLVRLALLYACERLTESTKKHGIGKSPLQRMRSSLRLACEHIATTEGGDAKEIEEALLSRAALRIAELT